jgi:zinc/manganese transport system substrate-binding protein
MALVVVSIGRFFCSEYLRIGYSFLCKYLHFLGQFGNPHYWLDPENGKIIADQIRTQLSQIDPENAGIYTKNYTQFVNTLNKKIAQWKQQLAPLNTHTFITYHSVWNYFFKAFKLQSIGELEPLPGIPPTTKHIAKLKKSAVNQTPRPIILTANYYPPKIGIAFAQSINTTHLVLTPHVDNKKTTTYLDLFDVIIETLTQ